MKGFKLENLPGVDDPFRKILLNNLTTYEDYLKDLKAGLPFFSEIELSEIEEKFKEKGMTRKDILALIYKKGWPLKENTLKHYIQIDQIPRAERREKSKSGMISYYPANTIRHLNFTRYCLFSGSETANKLTTIFQELSSQDKNILMAKSEETDPGLAGSDCIHALWIGLDRIDNGIGWTEETIKVAFGNNPTRMTMYLKKLGKIKQCGVRLEKEIKEFEDLLEEHNSPINLEERGDDDEPN
jgi:hypothetical protein